MIPSQQLIPALLANVEKEMDYDSIVYSNCSNRHSSDHKRRVTFSANGNETSSTVSPLDRLDTIAEIQSLWYNAFEAEQMLLEARQLCQKMEIVRSRKIATNQNCNASGFGADVSAGVSRPTPLLAMDGTTRGLEHRVCEERRRRRCVTIKAVRFAASALNNRNKNSVNNGSDFKIDQASQTLAQFSRKCTEWAQALAIEEATRDYIRAYDIFGIDCGNKADSPVSNSQNLRQQEYGNDTIQTKRKEIEPVVWHRNVRSRQTELQI
jgi:hypothetical protein